MQPLKATYMSNFIFKKKFFLSFLSIFVFTLMFSVDIFAQGDRLTLRLSGTVVDTDTRKPMLYAHVILPSAGVGTTTDEDGKFSMIVMPGDSLVFSFVSHRTIYYKVPADKVEDYTVYVGMSEQTQMLNPVEVFPYPTERDFKEAFLSRELESKELKEIKKRLSPETIEKLAMRTQADGGTAAQYNMRAQQDQINNQYMFPTLQLLNPFAWSQFIKSVKNGDLSKERFKKYNQYNKP